MYNLNDIEARIKAGRAVSDQERAYFITHNPIALYAFIIDNNPGNVNMTLRQMGYNHLGFMPDKTALAAQVGILIERNDLDALHKITQNFILLNNDQLTPQFVKALQGQLNTIH